MGKLTDTQEKVEAFIENNKIHVSSGAIVDKSLFQKKAAMEKEIRNAKEVISNSLGKFLLTGDRVENYITKGLTDDPNKIKLQFDCFIFSADQIREFVKEIAVKENRILH